MGRVSWYLIHRWHRISGDAIQAVLISAADLPFKVIICSRNRAALLAKHPVLGVAHVCVDTEYEAAQYRKVFGKVGRSPHDLHVLGESRTLCDSRQDALDLLWSRNEPFALMCDDDVSAFLPMMRYRTVRIADPGAMLTILWSTYVSASEMPTGIFGYAHTARPAERRANTPIRLRVWVDNTIMGILDRELRYDREFFAGGDIDISLQCIRNYGIICSDQRFAPEHQRWSAGELSSTRSAERKADSARRLQRR